MYLSRIQLRLERLQPTMLQKWSTAAPYAAHQWLWQLFPGRDERHFLFREEPQARFFVLSHSAPSTDHALFTVETRSFDPALVNGLMLNFQLRANPVITRNNKRSDVMMDAKFRAKAQGLSPQAWWPAQIDAARQWLARQGQQHGFELVAPPTDDFADWSGQDGDEERVNNGANVVAYQQHRFQRNASEHPITYSSVDYTGNLVITDAARFHSALCNGIGKSKALGCGMIMVKRQR
nr:type I-E CRISPR-associated protein Cas6/Cse3/CasE [uncultured Enterobacter sp.]